MPPTETTLALLSQRVETMQETQRTGFAEVHDVLKELTAAVSKLALVEERQVQLAAAQERAFKAIEKLEGRAALLEAQAPVARQTSEWVHRGIWAAAAAALTFVARKAGLL